MASTRAAEVAEILFELKRADKVATYTEIATRAGFSPGANGKTMIGCVTRVRRDWPHLQWWRAISDEGIVEEGSEHATALAEGGYPLESVDDGKMTLESIEDHLMAWNAEGVVVAVATADDDELESQDDGDSEE